MIPLRFAVQHWVLGYRLYSPSLDEASKGNYDVWFWTDVDKLPQGEITNWSQIYWSTGDKPGRDLQRSIRTCLH